MDEEIKEKIEIISSMLKINTDSKINQSLQNQRDYLLSQLSEGEQMIWNYNENI